MLVEALVAELAVEAFDVGVLRGGTRLDQDVLDAMLLRPGNEGATGELGAIVGADRAWIATETRRLIEQAHYVSPADAVIHGNVHALASEVVDHGQALDAACVGQRIEHEVHAPGVVRHGGRQQFLPLTHRTLGLAPFAHLQLGFLVQAINLFVIHGWKLRAQQIMQSAIAEAAVGLGQLDQPRRQPLRGWRRHGCVAESIAGQPRKAASPALAQRGVFEHSSDCLALALRG
ncbi:hypothetical protein AEA00_11460 [Xanthomonas campestris pv. campestris]|nr:hypothetical protein AEA00_11460 [Xanthomonas campestris pv. campestris]